MSMLDNSVLHSAGHEDVKHKNLVQKYDNLY